MEGKIKEVSISDEFLNKVKERVEEEYKNTQPIDCPYLKDKVYFNARGLDHIKFKEWNKPRTKFDQYLRLKLFHLVPEVLRCSHTVQGVWKRNEWERRKRHEKWEKILIEVSYYEFVAVIGKVRIKTVVKEVKGGQKSFWSIIPFWRMSESRDERKLYDRDLEKDKNVIGDVERYDQEKTPVS